MRWFLSHPSPLMHMTLHNVIRLEDATEFLVYSALFLTLDCSWWWYPALILAPDVGMLGYVISPRVGAFTYNILHHKTVAWCLAAGGIIAGITMMPSALPLKMAGFIMLAHGSMDRMMGYGLKHSDSFHHTHLGWLKRSV
jgi:hypothetical protein